MKWSLAYFAVKSPFILTTKYAKGAKKKIPFLPVYGTAVSNGNSNTGNLKTFSLFPGEERVGVIIIDKGLCFGIPNQFPP